MGIYPGGKLFILLTTLAVMQWPQERCYPDQPPSSESMAVGRISIEDFALMATNPQFTPFKEFAFLECRMSPGSPGKSILTFEFTDLNSSLTFTNAFVDVDLSAKPTLTLRLFRASRSQPAPTDDKQIRKLPNGRYEWSIEFPNALFDGGYELYYGGGGEPQHLKTQIKEPGQ